MEPLDEAIMARRSERMLQEFGLDQMVVEPIKRERQRVDDRPGSFTRIEYEGLRVVAQMWKERRCESSSDG